MSIRWRTKLIGLGVLVSVILTPYILFSEPADDSKFHFNKKIPSLEKSEEIFNYSYPSPADYKSSLLGLLLKTILSLGIITGSIYFILKFFFRGRGMTYFGGSLFKVIGTHALAPNKYIQLIEFGNILVLIGITENGINLLTQINDRETIDLIKTQASQSQATEGVSFSHHLKEFLKGFRRKELFDENLSKEQKIAFLKNQRVKLRRLLDR